MANQASCPYPDWPPLAPESWDTAWDGRSNEESTEELLLPAGVASLEHWLDLNA